MSQIRSQLSNQPVLDHDLTLLASGKEISPSFRVGASEVIFNELRSPDVNLVIWRRTVPRPISEQLVHWTKHCSARVERVVACGSYDVAWAIDGLQAPARRWIGHDLLQLMKKFSSITGRSQLKVEFGAVRSDRCRKFHVDYVHYRMVVTYLGLGTEWVPDEDVQRSAMMHSPRDHEHANRLIVPEASAMRCAHAGDVVIMKGQNHRHGLGAVHRSPPIEGISASRVVLVVSTID